MKKNSKVFLIKNPDKILLFINNAKKHKNS